MPPFIEIMDFIGIAVFAVSGSLVASRKEMDLIGFGLMASLTGIGGGTLRDIILGRDVFWLDTPYYVGVCLVVAVIVYFTAHIVQRRFTYVLWADAVGISAYAVVGADIALRSGATPLVAIVMGMMTATFGGLIRDVVCNETPLVLRKEIYATCTMLSAAVFVIARLFDTPVSWAVPMGFFVGFIVRAGGIFYGWSLPTYKARPGRDY